MNVTHATKIEVGLDYTAQRFRLNVRDNGRGLADDIAVLGRPGHWGIPGMRDRAERLGAALKFWSRIKLGTEVDLIVPGRSHFNAATRTTSGRSSGEPDWRASVNGAAELRSRGVEGDCQAIGDAP